MQRWEYIHVFIESQRIQGTGKFSAFGLGAEKTESVYAWGDINDEFNRYGELGWELLSLEPHWIWSTMTIGAPLWAVMANSRRRKVEGVSNYPELIAGWYATFRRPVATESR